MRGSPLLVKVLTIGAPGSVPPFLDHVFGSCAAQGTNGIPSVGYVTSWAWYCFEVHNDVAALVDADQGNTWAVSPTP